MTRLIAWILVRLGVGDSALRKRIGELDSQLHVERLATETAKAHVAALEEQLKVVETCREFELRTVHASLETLGAFTAKVARN